MAGFLFVLVAGQGCGRGEQRQTFSGSLEMTEHLLGARVAGRIATVAVKEGDEVEPGQLLATLDRYEQTKRDHQRTLQLQKQGGFSDQAVEQAALAMEDQEIRSPIRGVVLVKTKEVGEVAGAGTPVFDVGDRGDLWVRIHISEGLINRVRMDQPAQIHFDGLPQTFEGRVCFIAVKAEFTPRNVQTPEERVTQTFAVKVRLKDPPVYLRPGVSADVTLVFDGK